MCSCVPPFCGSCVENVIALSVVHRETSLDMGGQEKKILLKAVSFLERGQEVLLIGQPGRELKKDASRAGVPFKPVHMTPKLNFQENFG